ncbi:MAG: ABC transporter ATP-binding protein [Candidatus Neomarinimicrobiota bacterium]|nr:ABC transporter ATP-binding protein [Candidatus Neomarinimicrobiota bacterium]
MSVLSARNVKKAYSKSNVKIEVLSNISLDIQKGEIVGLMGPSGSGKSTLLNILGTLETDYEGVVMLDGRPVEEYDSIDKLRSDKIGFIFQFHHLLPEFTIYENIEIPLLVSGKEKSNNDIRKILFEIGLEKRSDHYPDEVSGGERQRAAVARALINDPKIILADEPTGNLDVENSQLLLNLILELRDKMNTSFIIASHDNLIKSIADRVLILDKGIIKEG